MHQSAQSEVVISKKEAADHVGGREELKRLLQEAYRQTVIQGTRSQTNGQRGLHLKELHEGMRLVTKKEGEKRVFIVRGAPKLPSS